MSGWGRRRAALGRRSRKVVQRHIQSGRIALGLQAAEVMMESGREAWRCGRCHASRSLSTDMHAGYGRRDYDSRSNDGSYPHCRRSSIGARRAAQRSSRSLSINARSSRRPVSKKRSRRSTDRAISTLCCSDLNMPDVVQARWPALSAPSAFPAFQSSWCLARSTGNSSKRRSARALPALVPKSMKRSAILEALHRIMSGEIVDARRACGRKRNVAQGYRHPSSDRQPDPAARKSY